MLDTQRQGAYTCQQQSEREQTPEGNIMSRRAKAVTLHPLAMAQSIEAQNAAASQFTMAVNTLLTVAGDALPTAVRDMIQAELDQFRAIMWPSDES